MGVIPLQLSRVGWAAVGMRAGGGRLSEIIIGWASGAEEQMRRLRLFLSASADDDTGDGRGDPLVVSVGRRPVQSAAQRLSPAAIRTVSVSATQTLTCSS